MTPQELGLTIAFAVIVVVNLIGNSLVCLIVLRYPPKRTPINYLLVNLAVSDILVALFITPQYVIRHAFKHPSGTTGDYFCKFITGGNFVWVGGASSGFSLVVVAFERYFAVTQPLNKDKRLTIRQLATVVAVCWLCAVVFNLPLFFVIQFQDGSFHCPEHWSNPTLAKAYTIACFFVFGAIPIGVMAILYSRAIFKLWNDKTHSALGLNQARIRARLKVTRMVVIVSVMYTLCWVPNLVLYILSKFKPEQFAYVSLAYIATVVLVSFNSAMNPFIYSLYSSNFRGHLLDALCCRKYRSLDFFVTSSSNKSIRANTASYEQFNEPEEIEST